MVALPNESIKKRVNAAAPIEFKCVESGRHHRRPNSAVGGDDVEAVRLQKSYVVFRIKGTPDRHRPGDGR